VVFNITDNVGSRGVIKMMKGEHDVDTRNFDRHRRDALVMERLTSSPYIVSVYSFCGNTVFTEFVGETLDEVIKDNRTVYPSRNTPRARLKLALDVAKGIQALHEVDGGPIAHTDIQSEQFLVDKSGRVKLNDFNRCRFVAHRNKTGEVCGFRIPSAPGAFRSPEEYEDSGLSEKLDIYSTTNVLYEILTGYEIWKDDRISKIRAKVMNGEKPPIPSEYLQPGSPDAGLVTLIGLGHEKSPDQRINASQMVAELESLLRANE
jgi:serine/threonine protein kinase